MDLGLAVLLTRLARCVERGGAVPLQRVLKGLPQVGPSRIELEPTRPAVGLGPVCNVQFPDDR
eukprot:2088683-Lingulodinium_polyedra.AAC.1